MKKNGHSIYSIFKCLKCWFPRLRGISSVFSIKTDKWSIEVTWSMSCWKCSSCSYLIIVTAICMIIKIWCFLKPIWFKLFIYIVYLLYARNALRQTKPQSTLLLFLFVFYLSKITTNRPICFIKTFIIKFILCF